MPDSASTRDRGPKRPSLELPLGARSCGGRGRQRGGRWEPCDSTNLTGERAAIEVMSRSRDDARLLRREMLTSMRLAEQGQLTCGLGRYVAGFCRRFVSSLMIGRIVPWVDPQLTQPRSHA